MSAVTGFRISPQQALAWRNQDDLTTACCWLRLTLETPAQVQTLAARLAQLAGGEEILRTCLQRVPGMTLPIQVIEETPRVAIQALDWSGLGEAQCQAQWAALRQAAPDRHVLAVWHVAMPDQTTALLLQGNAALLDVRSLELIAADLLGVAPPSQRLQYADYAEWKHGVLEDEATIQARHFWQQGRTQPVATVLPGLQATDTGSRCEPALHPVDDVDISLLRSAADAAGAALEDWLLAAWCCLLARLSGQATLTLDWFDAGRGEELEQALGLYEQRLPIQVQIDPARHLQAQLEPLFASLREARSWSDQYASEHASELYFAWRAARPVGEPGVRIEAWRHAQRFTLGLECRLDSTGLSMALAHDRSRLDDRAVTCIQEQWRALLHGLHDTDAPVGALDLAGPWQRQLLQPASKPQVTTQHVLDLIQARIDQHPERVALADGSGLLDYRSLGAQVETLALHLVSKGVAPGHVVGTLFRRDRRAIIAMLAVLKAGATYLPLDPNYPTERLAHMVADSGARLVLSCADACDAAPDMTPIALLEALVDEPPPTRLPAIDWQQPAYLIYTSGSSGRPKGVPITHASLSYSTQVRMAFYRDPVQAYLLLSSFSFDSSVAGIYWTLCQGGRLVLPATGQEQDLAVLTELIQGHAVSHGLSLPSLYEAILDYSSPQALHGLQTWIVAGEACPTRVLEKHQHSVPHAALVNEYGPTEATVWATADVLTDEHGNLEPISIGRPIPGMTLHLLNEQRQLAAVGEPGEIHLGGPTLTAGYLNQAEETATAFITVAAVSGGQRLYRTGDLARYRVDGRLEFIGRRDQQIKIRGHRIEQAEIEQALREHGDVRDAVVVARERDGHLRLVAYVTDRHGYPPAGEALANFLQDRLPAYMVPSDYVHLARFPSTPNGKVDLHALPDPDLDHEASAVHVAPRTELETVLVNICQQVLKRERIGVLDNFFRIGGDSILSLQIVARAKQAGIGISAKQIFECETIERLALVAVQLPADPAPLTPGSSPQSASDKPGRGTTTPGAAGDFPLAGLSSDALDDLLAELNDRD